MLPQLTELGSPRPRNSRAAQARMAKITVLTKAAATIPISLGRISAKMMRHALSPQARAAVTNSRLRIESVCARRIRALKHQFVEMITVAIVSGVLGK